MYDDLIQCPIYRNSISIPDAVALRSDDVTLTYRELEMRIQFCVKMFALSGIVKGDRLAVIASNSVEYAITIFVACRIGAALVPISTRMNRDTQIDCIQRAKCGLLLVDRQREQFAKESGFEYRLLETIEQKISPDPIANQDSTISHGIPLDLETSIVFTSGSEGSPKGAVLTFGNHYYNALASNENIRLDRGDCWLAALPFYHVGGMAILFRTALAGCSAYITGAFDAEQINRLIDDEKITHVSLVPTMLESLLSERNMKPFSDSLKVILLGGGPIPDSMIKTTRRLSLPVLTTYGMTEAASQICTMSPDDPKEKLSSSGRPLKHCEARIIGDDEKAVGANVEGDIAIRGRIVFKGYLEEESDGTFDSDGWFRTEDIGCFDEYGYLYVKDRKQDMFISGGENIYPSEIEKAALTFPGISDCAVIAVDDRKWGKRPVLFVKSGNVEFNISELRSYLEIHLSRILLPDAIIEIDELPRKSIGKIDRERLIEMYREQQ